MALHLKSTGIDFADFSGSPTSELLNDYEHGNWTLTASGTGTIGGGGATQKYCKVGQVVTATIDYIIATSGTLSNFAGLPITTGDDRQGGCVGYNNVAVGLAIYMSGSDDKISFYASTTHYSTFAQNEGVQAASMLYHSF